MSEFAAEVTRAETLLAAQRISDTGSALEIALSRFLGRLLPTHIGIGRGHVASRDWSEVSEEIDLVLYDRRYAAGFPYLGEPGQPGEHIGLFSADAVIGCVAVTKTLTRAKLKSSLANLKTATDLAPADMANRLHFDLEVTGAMTFRDGRLVNPVFSAVVGYTDQIFTSLSKGVRSWVTDEARRDRRLDSLLEIEGFRGSQVDLIYTVDGILLYPMEPSESGLRHPELPSSWIGQEKGYVWVEERETGVETLGLSPGDPPLLLFEDHREADPAVALRLFLTHIISASSWIVRRTPEFGQLMGPATQRRVPVSVPIGGRQQLLTE